MLIKTHHCQNNYIYICTKYCYLGLACTDIMVYYLKYSHDYNLWMVCDANVI